MWNTLLPFTMINLIINDHSAHNISNRKTSIAKLSEDGYLNVSKVSSGQTLPSIHITIIIKVIKIENHSKLLIPLIFIRSQT